MSYYEGDMSEDEADELAKKLEQDLLRMYGSPILHGADLQKALGYKSIYALRQAVVRKTLPVPTFRVANRRGTHALVTDIAKWLAEKAREENM